MHTPIEQGPDDERTAARRMFARYTEYAKRVIFFARYEASQHGSLQIATEHLLLGLFRGDRRLARKLLGSGGLLKRYTSSSSSMESIRRNVSVVGQKISSSQDLPLTTELKRVIKYAAEEADHGTDPHIRSKHLVVGLLREEHSLAAKLLNNMGVTLRIAREKLGVPAESIMKN